MILQPPAYANDGHCSVSFKGAHGSDAPYRNYPPRMKFLVDVAQPVAGDVGVDLGGADGGMAEEFLDDAEVGAVFEQVRGEAVSQHVRGDAARDAGVFDAFLDALPHGDRREGGAALGQEEVGGRAGRDQLGAAGGEVTVDGVDGFAADGDDAFLVALADDVDEAGLEMELLQTHAA